MKKSAAMVIAGLFVAAPSMATDVRQYIVIAPPVHMAHDTRNTQTLFCPNGDFAVSAGRWFQHNGVVVKFPETSDGGVPGSEIPILDKDADGAMGYQINTQNDGEGAQLYDYIQCLSLSGQVQERQ